MGASRGSHACRGRTGVVLGLPAAPSALGLDRAPAKNEAQGRRVLRTGAASLGALAACAGFMSLVVNIREKRKSTSVCARSKWAIRASSWSNGCENLIY